jgi:hypothetical protein
MTRLTTVCAIRSDTVGIPSFLVPPSAFGISTCFTGGGKYDPDDMRFHSLYRFFDRSCSNIAMVSSSMPADPRLALTCWYAFHTARFAITKGFIDAMSLIPAERVGDARQPDNAVPSLHPYYKGFFTTADSSAPRSGIGILPHGFCHLSFPFTSATRFSRSVPKPALRSCRLYTDCHRVRKQVSSRLIPGPMVNPGFGSTLRAITMRHRRFAFAHLLNPYLTSCDAFSPVAHHLAF